jgi:hypothetical protein
MWQQQDNRAGQKGHANLMPLQEVYQGPQHSLVLRLYSKPLNLIPSRYSATEMLSLPLPKTQQKIRK